jgi:type II restriction enzyme
VKSLKRLPTNFKCADVICDFCGYLAQVKTRTTKQIDVLPNSVPGAAWRVQKERMSAGIYFPLYLVQTDGRGVCIFYLAADLQQPSMFRKRRPLSERAKRKGWQGFIHKFDAIPKGAFIKLVCRVRKPSRSR